MSERPILMFDSGIGGLTVLREARVLMPDRRFVYVADDAAFPYGAWEEPALRSHILKLFRTLLDRFDPEISVIACNTASTLVIDALREAFPGHPFVGTVPAIKPAAERTRSGLGFGACHARHGEAPVYARPDHAMGAEMPCAPRRIQPVGGAGRNLHARWLCG